MRMVTLSNGKTKVCVQAQAGTLTAADIAALGYKGFTFVSESAALPAEQLSAADLETARYNAMTNAELMAEVKRLIAKPGPPALP